MRVHLTLKMRRFIEVCCSFLSSHRQARMNSWSTLYYCSAQARETKPRLQHYRGSPSLDAYKWTPRTVPRRLSRFGSSMRCPHRPQTPGGQSRGNQTTTLRCLCKWGSLIGWNLSLSADQARLSGERSTTEYSSTVQCTAHYVRRHSEQHHWHRASHHRRQPR
jgi:hypothetical protein